jgi:outer membrane protein OmpA-like peptidoglycan-associated protein
VLRRDLVERDYPFTLVGKGEDDAAVPNTSEANRKKNRRVVIVYDKR